MHEGTFQETLRCALTSKEVANRARELAVVQKQIEDNEAEAKAAADAFKVKRKRLEARRRELAREVRDESTFRLVECIQRYNAESGMIETVRTDTGDLVNERPATEAEKQPDMFDPPTGLGSTAPDDLDEEEETEEEDEREETDDPAAEDATEEEGNGGDATGRPEEPVG